MKKQRKRRSRLVKEINFKMKKGQSLVVSLWPHLGIERIIIENRKRAVEVRAEGRSRFEFSDKKDKKASPGTCDFFLSNPSSNVLLKDYLASRFWGQFTWGALDAYQKNKRLKKAVNEEIRKLVEQFEERASKRLKGIVKRFKK